MIDFIISINEVSKVEGQVQIITFLHSYKLMIIIMS